jgi:hypothetical protein
MKYGQNDLNLYGRVEKFYRLSALRFRVKGQLKATSQQLNLNDFFSENKSKKNNKTTGNDSVQSAMKTILIPENLNLSIDASVEKLTLPKCFSVRAKPHFLWPTASFRFAI